MKRLLCTFFLVILSLPAQAQTLDIANGEKVAIAFYKLSGLEPNFNDWAEDTEAFHAAPLALRDEVKAKEAARLKAAYVAFSPALNVINVSTRADILLEEAIDEKNPQNSKYFLTWSFAKGDADFFPYEFRQSFFAVVPREIEKFQHAQIERDQYEYLKDRIGKQPRATLILMLRGTYADPKAPVHLRGEDFWAISASVAGVSVWDTGGSILWENTAGWYVSPRTKALNDLHDAEKAE